MWADERGCTVSPYVPLIAKSLAAKSLSVDEAAQERIQARIRSFGRFEWEDIKDILASQLEPAKAQGLLGAGFAFTEFLAAPVVGAATPRTICSLGAIANLMVVTCDRLLDSGVPVETVLMENGMPKDATTNGLLELYWRKLETMQPDKSLTEIIQKVIGRMFAAEMETVRQGDKLPYRHWLAKSSLPFVLMGLPAWACQCRDSRSAAFERGEHVRWLTKVGRFFGVLDDAADYEMDVRSGDANYFKLLAEERTAQMGSRVAGWGLNILREWDSLVIAGPKSAIFRETFLNITWGWLNSAPADSDE